MELRSRSIAGCRRTALTIGKSQLKRQQHTRSGYTFQINRRSDQPRRSAGIISSKQVRSTQYTGIGRSCPYIIRGVRRECRSFYGLAGCTLHLRPCRRDSREVRRVRYTNRCDKIGRYPLGITGLVVITIGTQVRIVMRSRSQVRNQLTVDGDVIRIEDRCRRVIRRGVRNRRCRYDQLERTPGTRRPVELVSSRTGCRSRELSVHTLRFRIDLYLIQYNTITTVQLALKSQLTGSHLRCSRERYCYLRP